ncbi:MAG: hypothetical protein KY475_20935, partial [Planctomycetes bacterium]|nr:hypothetical protein [Planctomycetota bacterium]
MAAALAEKDSRPLRVENACGSGLCDADHRRNFPKPGIQFRRPLSTGGGAPYAETWERQSMEKKKKDETR